jgi:DNA-nicking Smr family endonuclease
VQSHTQATKQGYSTQSEDEPKTPNPHTGRLAGLNHLSRGLGKAAYRGLASRRKIDLHGETEEEARQPETKPGASPCKARRAPESQDR